MVALILWRQYIPIVCKIRVNYNLISTITINILRHFAVLVKALSRNFPRKAEEIILVSNKSSLCIVYIKMDLQSRTSHMMILYNSKIAFSA